MIKVGSIANFAQLGKPRNCWLLVMTRFGLVVESGVELTTVFP